MIRNNLYDSDGYRQFTQFSQATISKQYRRITQMRIIFLSNLQIQYSNCVLT